jgi:hypothetical protein
VGGGDVARLQVEEFPRLQPQPHLRAHRLTYRRISTRRVARYKM